MNVEQKTFRDFFGKDIKVGDIVLHLWAQVYRDQITGAESAIKHKRAKVVAFSKKGVRIEWKKNHTDPMKQSTVFNTRNRLIILKNGVLEFDEECLINEAMKSYESYKKGMNTRIAKLRRDATQRDAYVDELTKELEEKEDEIRDLTNALQSMRSDIYRFELVDFDE